MSSIIALLSWALILGQYSFVVTADVLADLDALQSTTEALLRDHEQDETLTKLDLLVNELAEEHADLDKLEQELLHRTKELEGLIQTINARQIEFLSKQLTDTVHAELESRKGTENETVGVEEDYSQALSLNELKNAITEPVEKILEDMDDGLENWMVDLVGNYVMDFRKKKALQFVATAAKEATKSRDVSSTESSNSCLTPANGAFLIQETLSKQSSAAETDYFASAVVVHEFTSQSYSPQVKEPLGQVPLRRYIPEDIERLLPEGWEDWNVAIPPAMYRLLNMPHKAVTLPPEAILDANIHPGACWPMSGSSGHITLRLAEPIAFNSLTIDHSPVLTLDGSSAPKTVNVIGYPPCSDKCGGLGFDMEQPQNLMQIEYDIDGPASQTFSLAHNDAGGSAEGGSCNSGGGGASQCSSGGAPPGPCSGGPAFGGGSERSCNGTGGGAPREENGQPGKIVAGIRIEVAKNWGNADYTCIYRMKAHGQLL